MCCFSRPVRFVGGTKIFARLGADDRQLLAYAMNVEIDEELAMVLPLPVPPGSRDDAVTFINLEGYEDFFKDLERAFPVLMPQSRSLGFGPPTASAPLVVHDVGQFIASFVPARADFARLDARFRMNDEVWDDLPGYADWGFAVFQLKPNRTKKQSVHPMAFSFPTREPRSLFYPTVHVHDGHVAKKANFDHALYCQADGVLEATLPWTRSAKPLGAYVDVARTHDLVLGDRGGFKEAFVGQLTNEDVWLREPIGVELGDLRGSGECWAYEASAHFAYAFGWLPANIERWRETGRTRLGPLCRGLRSGLEALTAARRAAWQLAPLTPDLPPHFMNGDKLWTGSDYMTGKAAATRGRGFITFSPFTERVHTQSVRLGFEELPDEGKLAEIRAELAALLDRAAWG